MSEVKRLDVSVSTDNTSEGAYTILEHLRPEWKKQDIHFKVCNENLYDDIEIGHDYFIQFER